MSLTATNKNNTIWHHTELSDRPRQVFVPQRALRSKKSIPIENFNPGLKFSIPIEIFKRDQKFQSRSFYFRGPAGVQKRARSKISIHDRSLEIFNPEGCDRIFSIPGPSGTTVLSHRHARQHEDTVNWHSLCESYMNSICARVGCSPRLMKGAFELLRVLALVRSSWRRATCVCLSQQQPRKHTIWYHSKLSDVSRQISMLLCSRIGMPDSTKTPSIGIPYARAGWTLSVPGLGVVQGWWKAFELLRVLALVSSSWRRAACACLSQQQTIKHTIWYHSKLSDISRQVSVLLCSRIGMPDNMKAPSIGIHPYVRARWTPCVPGLDVGHA